MDDDWKDGVSAEDSKGYAEYMARISREFFDAFISKNFSREEALRLTIAIVPMGCRREPQ